MTPVRQTRFVAEHGAGNCQSAAMASILELPLEDVVDTSDPEVRARGFWREVNRWLASRGLALRYDVGRDDPAILEGAYSIGSGPSPRGDFWHAVVCKNGRMVWDPHPSDDGLAGEVVRHDVIVPATPSNLASWGPENSQ